MSAKKDPDLSSEMESSEDESTRAPRKRKAANTTVLGLKRVKKTSLKPPPRVEEPAAVPSVASSGFSGDSIFDRQPKAAVSATPLAATNLKEPVSKLTDDYSDVPTSKHVGKRMVELVNVPEAEGDAEAEVHTNKTLGSVSYESVRDGDGKEKWEDVQSEMPTEDDPAESLQSHNVRPQEEWTPDQSPENWARWPNLKRKEKSKEIDWQWYIDLKVENVSERLSYHGGTPESKAFDHLPWPYGRLINVPQSVDEQKIVLLVSERATRGVAKYLKDHHSDFVEDTGLLENAGLCWVATKFTNLRVQTDLKCKKLDKHRKRVTLKGPTRSWFAALYRTVRKGTFFTFHTEVRYGNIGRMGFLFPDEKASDNPDAIQGSHRGCSNFTCLRHALFETNTENQNRKGCRGFIKDESGKVLYCACDHFPVCLSVQQAREAGIRENTPSTKVGA